MDPYLTDAMGADIVPLWSLKHGMLWCSINDTLDRIPTRANDYIKMSIPLLPPSTSPELIKDFDFMIKPVYYNSEEHWLGYIPTKGSIEFEGDPLAMCFDRLPVETVSEFVTLYSSSDDGLDGHSELAGYTLAPAWTDSAIVLARRLHSICVSLALSTDFYGRDSCTQAAVGNVKRSIMSLVGFVSWFQTVKEITATDLSLEDRAFVQELRLKDRPKTGYLFNLTRNMHEINLPHLTNHDMPFHFPWTDIERASPRFRRLGPEFWGELSNARQWADGRTVDLPDLASYESWKDDFERFDVYFQDGRAGKRGEAITEFHPEWTYRIVDFRLYGARRLRNWNVICAYSERFKATVQETQGGEIICTFFRQNPLKEDEPPHIREWPLTHAHELEDFATQQIGEAIEEDEAFFESTSRFREQVKNKFAPRPGRTFNSYNGKRDGEVTGNAPPFELNVKLASESGSSSSGARTSLLERLGPRIEESASLTVGASVVPVQGRTVPVSEAVIEQVDVRAEAGLISQDLIAQLDSPALAPMSPTRRSAQTQDEGLTSKWAREVAASGSKRRSSSSPPGRRDVKEGKRRARSRTLGFDDEFDSVTQSDEPEEGEYEEPVTDLPFVSINSSPVGPSRGRFDAVPSRQISAAASYSPKFGSRSEALDAIREWMPSVMESEPVWPVDAELQWSLKYLCGAILVCKDERTYWRLKSWAACAEHQVVLEDVLEAAIRCGMAFSWFVEVQDVRKYAELDISDLVRNTVEALYAPGYVDTLLEYGHGGAALYGRYRVQMGALIPRPNAVAFLGLGGIYSFVALKFDPLLARRFAKGPSMQVTEFLKGETLLHWDGERDVHYMTDQVTESEKSMLLGHIPSGPMSETTLWPSNEVLESESLHFRGYISSGCLDMFENLYEDITKKHKFVWRTRAGWKQYFKRGNTGTYAPKVVPSAKDFVIGQKLFERSFPVDWEYAQIATLKFPEIFDSGSPS
ncbi:hypothetical protein C8R43DRAFT_1120150 [Mycena crocata]|nr:hypothetical protein C8R43DRAFT_1120150 [Mycena crocata]